MGILKEFLTDILPKIIVIFFLHRDTYFRDVSPSTIIEFVFILLVIIAIIVVGITLLLQLYASFCVYMGVRYINRGEYAKAEKYCLKAKAVRGNALGKEYPGYAELLMYLGWLYTNKGKHAKAEEYYREADAIMEKGRGKKKIQTSKKLLTVFAVLVILGTLVLAVYSKKKDDSQPAKAAASAATPNNAMPTDLSSEEVAARVKQIREAAATWHIDSLMRTAATPDNAPTDLSSEEIAARAKQLREAAATWQIDSLMRTAATRASSPDEHALIFAWVNALADAPEEAVTKKQQAEQMAEKAATTTDGTVLSKYTTLWKKQ
jgi:tetratricopeptide (TPR) repeat protein